MFPLSLGVETSSSFILALAPKMLKISIFNSIAYLWWLITIPFVSTVWQDVLLRERAYYKLEGKSLTGNVSETRKVKEFSDCSFLCLRLGITSCLSFNIGKITDTNGFYTCELSTSEKYLELDESFRDRISYDYCGTSTTVSNDA